MRLRTALTAIALTALLGAASVGAPEPPPLNVRFGPPPPDGPFLMVNHAGHFFAFVVEGSMTRRGSVADLWFYEVVDPPQQLGQRSASQVLEHMQFDCRKRIAQELGHWVFDDADGEIGAVDSDKPEAPRRMARGDRQDLRSRYVCNGMTLDVEVANRAAARALAKRLEAAGE